MAARILAVEDTPHNLDLMTYLLEASGHIVLNATTGAAGLAVARSERPDLLVLDVQLPDLDGYAVLAELRSDPVLSAVPVVAVTAFAMVGDRDHALAAGFNGYLAKPIDPVTFVASIEAHLPKALRGRPIETSWGGTDTFQPDLWSSVDGPSLRIVVAQISDVNLAVLRSTLEPHGHQIVRALSPDQAREELASETPDLVMIEVDPQRGYGTGLLGTLRSDPNLGTAAVALIASPDVARNLVTDGVAVIESPIEPHRVMTHIEKLLPVRDKA